MKLWVKLNLLVCGASLGYKKKVEGVHKCREREIGLNGAGSRWRKRNSVSLKLKGGKAPLAKQ